MANVGRFYVSPVKKKEHQISQIYSYVAPGLVQEERSVENRWKKIYAISPSVRRSIIDDFGWERPTPIQKKIFDLTMKEKSIVASSETGSGKTAAYAAPMISYIEKSRKNAAEREKQEFPEDTRLPRGEFAPRGLILVPTRELANQIYEHINKLATCVDPPIRIECLAHSTTPTSLRTSTPNNPVDIVIATTGRALAHAHQRSTYLTNKQKFAENAELFTSQGLDLSWVKWFVIDECDKLLSLGFFPDIKEILSYMPRPRKKIPIITSTTKRTQEEKEGRKIITHVEDRMKVLLFTATLVPEISELIKRIAPQHVTVNLNQNMDIADNVDDIVHLVSNRRKYSLLKYYLKRRGSAKYEQVLTFCRTQQRVERLVEQLSCDKISAGGIYKEMSTKQRMKVLQDFKDNKIQVLVATDVLGRGIDIEGLPFVINYDMPISPTDYIHRVGRTGRATLKGNAISFVGSTPIMLNFGGRFVEHNEQHMLQKIRTFSGRSMHFRKVPGPWTDDPYDNIVQHEEMESQQFTEKKEKEIMKIMHSKEESVLGKGMYERLLARADARKKNPTRARYLPAKELTKGLSLRQFRHGRYEDMVIDYDIKRAKNRGVHVPEKYEYLVHSGKRKQLPNKDRQTNLSSPNQREKPSPAFTVK